MSTSAPLESRASEQLRLAFENAPIGIAVVDLDGSFARVNSMLCRITGYPADQLLALTFQQITHAEDLEKDLDLAAELLAGKRSSYQMEKRYLRADGSDVWVNLSGSIARDDDGQPLYFIAHVEDITDRVAAREALRHYALHDQLTGLANRQYLIERLHQALELVERRRHQVAVLFCDVDQLKDINDTLGHEAGDAVLVEVAHRISSVLRASDTASRIGGDEFVILCEDIDAQVEAFRIVDRLRSSMRVPIQHQDEMLDVTMSIGVAFSGSSHEDLNRLLRDADRAMYRDKARRSRPRRAGLSMLPTTRR
jgi:diguanylate cyclase (GGDEF)-like protein/PAS domain S-box-containing protein